MDENIAPLDALTREEVEALGRIKGSVIYKVYFTQSRLMYRQRGEIRKTVVADFRRRYKKILSSAKGPTGLLAHIPLGRWYGANKLGYLFSNYFHALAYSMKLKQGSHHGQDDNADQHPAP